MMLPTVISGLLVVGGVLLMLHFTGNLRNKKFWRELGFATLALTTIVAAFVFIFNLFALFS